MKEIFSVDSAITYQESHWSDKKNSVDMKGKRSRPFITISREYGCLGYSAGEALAKILNSAYKPELRWTVFDRHILDRLMKDMNLAYKLLETLTEDSRTSMADYIRITFTKYPPEAVIYKKLVEAIRIIAANGHAIIVGRVGNVITSDMPRGYHVRLFASRQQKIENIKNQFNISAGEAKKLLEKKGEAREKFILRRLKVDMNAPSIYDVMINTTNRSMDETARFIMRGMELSGIIKPRKK
jgi:cytidylate kinase